jgi:hypothetical protein
MDTPSPRAVSGGCRSMVPGFGAPAGNAHVPGRLSLKKREGTIQNIMPAPSCQ